MKQPIGKSSPPGQVLTFLDIEAWSRKASFHYFKEYAQPFFNISAEVNVTSLVRACKDAGLSFFQASLFLSLKSANEIESFRYRLRGDRVAVYDVVHGGSTVLNKDETFGFCYFDYNSSFEVFRKMASKALVENSRLATNWAPRDDRDDLIHYSMIPWISFTSFSHARKPHKCDSIPKIVLGKYYEADGGTKMPVSVEVHHALMDGIHVAKFFDRFQELLNLARDHL